MNEMIDMMCDDMNHLCEIVGMYEAEKRKAYIYVSGVKHDMLFGTVTGPV